MATSIITETAAGTESESSPLDRFLEALRAKGVDYTSAGARATTYACPVHHDKDRAASATLTDEGRLLLRCHACHAGFVETLKAVGLTPRDVPSGRSRAGGPVAPGPRRGRDEVAPDEHVDRMMDLACDYEWALDHRPDMLAELSRRLGVSAEALTDIGAGYRDERNPCKVDGRWIDRGPCWTFPEQDHRQAIIGIGTRYVDPQYGKAAVKGSRRGLIIPTSFEFTTEGPVYIVEGPSDVAALLTAGHCAVGRPSAAGGAWELTKLLADLDPGRQIIILAENDRKEDGRWPGREGAERVAAVLRRELRRDVAIMFPPAEHKDARSWLNALAGIKHED